MSTASVPLLVRAARTGGLVWVEERLFERTGAAAVAAGTPDRLASPLAVTSGRAAWRAAQLRPQLPTLHGRSAGSFVAAPAAEVAAAVDLLDDLPAAEVAAVVARVWLPWLAAVSRRLGDGLVPVADGALARVLGHTERDRLDDLVDLTAALLDAGDDGIAPVERVTRDRLECAWPRLRSRS